eukprot:Awhi_evm1s11456
MIPAYSIVAQHNHGSLNTKKMVKNSSSGGRFIDYPDRYAHLYQHLHRQCSLSSSPSLTSPSLSEKQQKIYKLHHHISVEKSVQFTSQQKVNVSRPHPVERTNSQPVNLSRVHHRSNYSQPNVQNHRKKSGSTTFSSMSRPGDSKPIAPKLVNLAAKKAKAYWDANNSYTLDEILLHLNDLILRINCSTMSFVYALIYMENLHKKFPKAGASSCAKRVIIMNLRCATKFLKDAPKDNRTWSDITHLPLGIMNSMEIQFLKVLNSSTIYIQDFKSYL